MFERKKQVGTLEYRKGVASGGFTVATENHVMEGVSVKGLVIAILVALLLNTLGGVAGVSLFAEAMTQESVLAIEKQTHFLLFAFAVGLFATFTGDYISAK